MKERNRSKGWAAVWMLLDAGASIAMLLMSLQLVDNFTADITEVEQLNYAASPSTAVALFFILAAGELIRIFSRRERTKFSTARHIAGVVLFAASGALLLQRSCDYISSYAACTAYALMLVLGCVERMVRDRRGRSIALNVFLILIIVILLALPTNVIFVPILIVIQSLVHIGGMAFSQINFKVLEKIIRKTYMIEFVFGMGKALLSGNVFCGHCGGRIFASTARRAHHPTNASIPARVPIYKCYNKTQHQRLCDGPTTYVAEKVDRVVEELLKGIFEKCKGVNESTFFNEQAQAATAQYYEKLKIARADHAKATRELSKWADLMLSSIEGTCVFTPEQIKNRMDALQQSISELSDRIQSLETSATNSEQLVNEIREQHKRILSWAEMYDSASLEEKKMVASYLIKAVTISRGYEIQVELHINEAQYQNGMEMG